MRDLNSTIYVRDKNAHRERRISEPIAHKRHMCWWWKTALLLAKRGCRLFQHHQRMNLLACLVDVINARVYFAHTRITSSVYTLEFFIIFINSGFFIIHAAPSTFKIGRDFPLRGGSCFTTLVENERIPNLYESTFLNVDAGYFKPGLH
jgi:hypothetical protein